MLDYKNESSANDEMQTEK